MAEWEEIVDAVGRALGGDRESGLAALMDCWEGTREGDHAQRCVIAHYVADLQASLEDEVLWDQVALAEHAHVADADLTPVGIASAVGMAPSLHLNLGDGYLRQGRLREAEAELEKGLQKQHVLPADGYGGMIRSGLDRLRLRLQEATSQEARGSGPDASAGLF